MTEDDRDAEIAAMVTERNELRREIACLDNKLDRIKRALSDVRVAIETKATLRVVRGDGITTGVNAATLPSVGDILETNNRRNEAEQRLDVLNRRIDGV